MKPPASDEEAPSLAGTALFRAEALAEHAGGGPEVGELLRWMPAWVVWGYRLLWLSLVAAALFGAFARSHEMASGPGVVRRGGSSGGVDGPVEVVAFVPVRYQRFLSVGGEVLLRPDGFPSAVVHSEISKIGPRAANAQAVRRLVRPGDVGAVAGPMVELRAVPTGSTFESAGASYSLTEGMAGRVEVPVRDEPLALALFPGLRRLVGGAHG